MKLTQKELAWFARLEKCLSAAPESLRKKDVTQLRAFTIGDADITVYDAEKYDKFVEDNYKYKGYDVGVAVGLSDSAILNLEFPFTIESTAG